MFPFTKFLKTLSSKERQFRLFICELSVLLDMMRKMWNPWNHKFTFR